jgi:hypothetical protein
LKHLTSPPFITIPALMWPAPNGRLLWAGIKHQRPAQSDSYRRARLQYQRDRAVSPWFPRGYSRSPHRNGREARPSPSTGPASVESARLNIVSRHCRCGAIFARA